MTYFTGGYTQAHFSSVNMIRNAGGSGAAFSTVPSQTYGGWFLGSGVETKLPWFGNGWFARTEYRYAYYGSHNLPDSAGGTPIAFVSIRPYVQTVRSELVYKFNPGGAGSTYSAPPPAPPQHGWTGFYVNGGVGYGMYNADTVWTLPGGGTFLPFTQTQGGRGWLGTAGAGYDYQLTGNIVAGVLGDYDFASIKGTIQNQGPFTVGTMTENWAWAVGARIGWLITPELLSYVNGGYTQAHFSSADMIVNFSGAGNTLSTVPSHTYSGWFLGGGVERKLPWFGEGWFIKTEYRYASYDSETLPDNAIGGGAPIAFVSIRPYVQTVRSELVYKFNSAQ